MAIVCPYCQHTMHAKGVRSGRFTPKCAKCNQTFQLVISPESEPRFKASPLPGKHGNPPMAAVPGATAIPADVSSENADFSVGASPPAVAAASGPDLTAALEQTSAPLRRSPAVLEPTEQDIPTSEAPAFKDDAEIPEVLGGYQIIRELGRGGMGAVYLARQVSLDRPVALKVMKAEWANNHNFLVRFTREAYAAAQLVHHNIVQVYDIGDENGINFFSMEYVEGRSLGDIVKQQGRIAPEEAVGYALQAARGLKFAHDRGMIHRDIKPDNLLLNEQGVVKVADLGLVRTPGMADEKPLTEGPAAPATEPPPVSPSGVKSRQVRALDTVSGVTMAGQSMGTPSYMSPEQARDATAVDHRADVYSLGCTLYVLLTGKPVYSGSTALEVMTKHAYDPVPRPETAAKDVPKALSDIVVKMLAKKREDRYASMDEVIRAFEDFMGIQSAGKHTSSEQHVKTLEQCVRAFQKAPAAALRSFVLLGFFGGCASLTLLFILFGIWRLAGLTAGLGAMTAAAYFVVHGMTHRTHVFLKLRDLLLSTTSPERGKIALGFILFTAVLFLLGQFWYWLLAALLAAGLALGMHFALDRRITRQRDPALARVESLLKTLRLRGLSEEALHEFVCKYAGEHWEEFFEALFGYEAKLAARAQYGAGPKGPRPRHGSWREPVIRWIERSQRARQEVRQKKHLQVIEQKSLEAQGVAAAEAKARAEAVAAAMVQKAAEIKKEPVLPAGLEVTVAPEQAAAVVVKAPPRRVNLQDILEIGVKGGPEAPTRSRTGLALSRLLAAPFGGTVRFTLGAGLFALGLVWLHLHGLLPSASNFDDTAVWANTWNKGIGDPKPFEVRFLPEKVLQALAGIAPAIAGLTLLVSAMWRSWKIGILVLLGAAIMVIGPVTGLAPEGILPVRVLCVAAGGAVAALGFVFGRET